MPQANQQDGRGAPTGNRKGEINVSHEGLAIVAITFGGAISGLYVKSVITFDINTCNSYNSGRK